MKKSTNKKLILNKTEISKLENLNAISGGINFRSLAGLICGGTASFLGESGCINDIK
ncbi:MULTISPECIES: hypothetical protein [Aquimarina]|uniref:hypothetical protein n=1 Tax=Aquimarina TaxID=290174 RepID=UPI000A9882C6|nr:MULTISPECIES: hypothetical protein [Aquimarina]